MFLTLFTRTSYITRLVTYGRLDGSGHAQVSYEWSGLHQPTLYVGPLFQQRIFDVALEM